MSHIARKLSVSGLVLWLFAMAFFLQAHLLINWDVTWDLLVTRRLLAGGTYTKDFFDMNPPLIFYEYMPVIFFQHILAISESIALQIYVFLLSLTSIFFCAYFSKEIFSKNDVWLRYSFLLAILFVFLILPVNDFGQREHLLLIFTLPWFLMVVSRLQGNKPSLFLALFTGLFAALGFAIKPYFIMPFIFVELYYMVSTRRLFSWVRVEVVVILLFLVLYGISVIVFYPDYLSTIVPVTRYFYYDGMSDSWLQVLGTHCILFCYFVLSLYLIQYKNKNYVSLKSVMAIALAGFIIAYVLQKTNWTYHLYPSYAMALLLSILFLGIFIQQAKYIGLLMLYFAGLFMFVTVHTNYLYRIAEINNESTNSLVTFLKKNADKSSVFFIGAASRDLFPAISYTNAQYASRFLHLFWMPAIIKNHDNYNSVALYQQYKKTENALTEMVVEDIKTRKPEFILVDIKEIKPFFSYIHFNYLAYLNQNSDFKMAFKPYHYFATIENAWSSENKLRPFNVKKWSLYFFPDRKDVSLSNINNYSIVLTGTGKLKRAYIVINKKWVTKKSETYYINMALSPEAYKLVSGKHGLIERNKQNAPTLNTIIMDTTIYPFYKFAVYRRDHEISGRKE